MNYQRNEITIFPCDYEFDENYNTLERCVVCKMPMENNNQSIAMFNTKLEFCCKDCKEHYKQFLNNFTEIMVE